MCVLQSLKASLCIIQDQHPRSFQNQRMTQFLLPEGERVGGEKSKFQVNYNLHKESLTYYVILSLEQGKCEYPNVAGNNLTSSEVKWVPWATE